MSFPIIQNVCAITAQGNVWSGDYSWTGNSDPSHPLPFPVKIKVDTCISEGLMWFFKSIYKRNHILGEYFFTFKGNVGTCLFFREVPPGKLRDASLCYVRLVQLWRVSIVWWDKTPYQAWSFKHRPSLHHSRPSLHHSTDRLFPASLLSWLRWPLPPAAALHVGTSVCELKSWKL